MPQPGFVLPLAAVFLIAGGLAAGQPLPLARSSAALAALQELKGELGLDPQSDFLMLSGMIDRQGAAHVRFRQRFQPVFKNCCDF